MRKPVGRDESVPTLACRLLVSVTRLSAIRNRHPIAFLEAPKEIAPVSERPRLTVLVVEEENDSRQLIVESLEAAGFAAAQSPNAADALARLDGFAYDGLVVDVRLPDADGLDVLDEALSRYPDMRCLVTAGFGNIEHAVRALKRGAVDF